MWVQLGGGATFLRRQWKCFSTLQNELGSEEIALGRAAEKLEHELISKRKILRVHFVPAFGCHR